MKKILSALLVLFVAFLPTLSAFAKEDDYAYLREASKDLKGTQLNVYNWGEYISDGKDGTLDVNAYFEEITGITVNYTTYDTNEDMYTKLKSGGASYDIIIPSDYMIESLMREDMLQPLDQSKLTNLSKLCKQVQNMPYDEKNTYSVPYFWGNVGIVYDTRKVTLADLEKENYDILRDTRFKGDIFMYDSERDGFMVAFKQLGYSCNTENEDEINAAYEWLLDLGKTMEPVYVTDEVIDGMMNATKAMGIVYSGDAVMILEENENMAYYVPSCGTNVWVDAMVIPKNAENPELAYEFMNYVSGYDAAMDNSVTVGYTSPNTEVMNELAEGDYADIPSYIPRTDNPNDEVFVYDAEARKIIAELWSKVKIAAGNAN